MGKSLKPWLKREWEFDRQLSSTLMHSVHQAVHPDIGLTTTLLQLVCRSVTIFWLDNGNGGDSGSQNLNLSNDTYLSLLEYPHNLAFLEQRCMQISKQTERL
jgi:hypothetical protein